MRAVHYFGRRYRWTLEDVRKLTQAQISALVDLNNLDHARLELERRAAENRRRR